MTDEQAYMQAMASHICETQARGDVIESIGVPPQQFYELITAYWCMQPSLGDKVFFMGAPLYIV